MKDELEDSWPLSEPSADWPEVSRDLDFSIVTGNASFIEPLRELESGSLVGTKSDSHDGHPGRMTSTPEKSTICPILEDSTILTVPPPAQSELPQTCNASYTITPAEDCVTIASANPLNASTLADASNAEVAESAHGIAVQTADSAVQLTSVSSASTNSAIETYRSTTPSCSHGDQGSAIRKRKRQEDEESALRWLDDAHREMKALRSSDSLSKFFFNHLVDAACSDSGSPPTKKRKQNSEEERSLTQTLFVSRMDALLPTAGTHKISRRTYVIPQATGVFKEPRLPAKPKKLPKTKMPK